MSKQCIYVDSNGDYVDSSSIFEESDHVASSAGVGDAGKPILLDAAGLIDSSMINFGSIDHGSLSGLADDDHTQYILVDGTRAFTGNQDMGSNKITGLADPTLANDATNKSYVDSVAIGLRPKGTVAVATTANITLSGLQTLDTYLTVAGDRVLVKDQTDQKENGIYVAAAGAWARSEDQDNSPLAEIVNGVFIPTVLNGSVNVDSPFFISSVGSGSENVHVIGVDNIVFDIFTSPSQLQAGDGIDIAANIVSVDLKASGGLKIDTTELAVEPADFAGDGVVDDGADNIAIDWASTFTIDSADAKAFKASDIASTTNAQGASIVGVEDASSYYSGSDVESVLNEVEAQIGGDTSSTYNFTESNVLSDNDSLYPALEKLDLKWGDLASTANGEGASIVSIEDAGSYFTSTVVEGALQELGEAISANGVEYTVGAGGVTKGDAVYLSGNDTVSIYSNIQVAEVIVGLALETKSAGQQVKVLANDTTLTSILGGAAVAGTKYYWNGSGYTSVLGSFSSGDYIWLGGVAANLNDAHVQTMFIKKQL